MHEVVNRICMHDQHHCKPQRSDTALTSCGKVASACMSHDIVNNLNELRTECVSVDRLSAIPGSVVAIADCCILKQKEIVEIA
jgi:hypothetical protein